MISIVLPTRNRPLALGQTLEALGAIRLGPAEVLVADNGSCPPAVAPAQLGNGVPVRVVRREINHSAASRNGCVARSSPDSQWVIMLDDDSEPLDAGFLEVLAEQPPDVAAVAAKIVLPSGQHEAGGLPEVFIGCGVALRRRVFLDLGGYDHTFDYYAEEYDLAARMISAGHRVVFDPRFRVLHRKDTSGRDFSRILRRLVRNNAWVGARYAPPDLRAREVIHTLRRYATIARKERVVPAYARAIFDLAFTLPMQRRTPMTQEHFDRFTGLAAARAAVTAAHRAAPLGSVALVAPGKNAWCVAQALTEMAIRTVPAERADTLVIATMSPVPMFDAFTQLQPLGQRVVAPWEGVGRAIASHNQMARRTLAA